jgi:hypothetical protein
MRAILIDPMNQEVKEVEYSGDYKDIYKLIECRTFDIVRIPVGNDGIYIDDEGLFAPTQFKWHYRYNKMQPAIRLVNKGLVLGCNDEGDTIGCDSSAYDIKRNIIWSW